MVNGFHTKHIHFELQIAADAAHAQDPQCFALGVVAQGGRRVAFERAAAERLHRGIEVAQRAEDEEDGRVGRAVVGDAGDVADQERRVAGGAGVGVDLVVAGSFWSLVGPPIFFWPTLRSSELQCLKENNLGFEKLTVVCQEPPLLGRGLHQFFIEPARDARRGKSPVCGNHIVEPSTLAFLDEFFPVGGFGCDDFCNLGQLVPFVFGSVVFG